MPNYEKTIITSVYPYAGNQILAGADGDGVLKTTRLYTSPLTLLSSSSPDAPLTIPSTAIQGVYVDGLNIWATTYDNGVVLLGPDQMTGLLQIPQTNTVSETFCRAIDHDKDGHIWVAYFHSICEYEHANSQPRVFLDDVPGLLAVKAASDGTVWCGGYNTGLCERLKELNPKLHIDWNTSKSDMSYLNYHSKAFNDVMKAKRISINPPLQARRASR